MGGQPPLLQAIATAIAASLSWHLFKERTSWLDRGWDEVVS